MCTSEAVLYALWDELVAVASENDERLDFVFQVSQIDQSHEQTAISKDTTLGTLSLALRQRLHVKDNFRDHMRSVRHREKPQNGELNRTIAQRLTCGAVELSGAAEVQVPSKTEQYILSMFLRSNAVDKLQLADLSSAVKDILPHHLRSLSEVCSMCGKVIAFEDVRWGKCEAGHQFSK